MTLDSLRIPPRIFHFLQLWPILRKNFIYIFVKTSANSYQIARFLRFNNAISLFTCTVLCFVICSFLYFLSLLYASIICHIKVTKQSKRSIISYFYFQENLSENLVSSLSRKQRVRDKPDVLKRLNGTVSCRRNRLLVSVVRRSQVDRRWRDVIPCQERTDGIILILIAFAARTKVLRISDSSFARYETKEQELFSFWRVTRQS